MKNKVLQLDEKQVNEFWRLRKELFEELGEISQDSDTFELELATKQYFLDHVNQDLYSWGIEHQGKLVALGSLCLFSRLPYKENLSGSEGYILNIYTSVAYRRNGYAKWILETIIAYSRKNNIRRLWLNYSKTGEFLYLKKGFSKKNHEMELFL